ncbi:porin family protein [Aequorivita viscosa]|uniref:Outer membrane protein beta-barrel domain-containing protein n=1 Tax=Aequorivita viscosa TaxID=797419 RepID=A0A1M6N3V1_9FLAO|nr:porin family protein [Aequorivita viscosa]SDX41512.1 Outer membrane protein beta-barrel domain-containing protein [Aequorivita viscosa]SHJ90360.1 Outer membrane protein beta-barrel domain-containing protein [Aequorivita viscosa]
MKKTLLIIIAAFTLSTQAQETLFGVKAGLNLASIGGDDAGDAKTRSSFHIGGLVEIPVSEKFSVQPELLYSSQGAKGSEELLGEGVIVESKIKSDYINIPIMAKYYLIQGLSIEAGPQFGFLVSAKAEFELKGPGVLETASMDVKDLFNTFDLGVGLGTSYTLDMGVFFGARYNLGLSNINKDSGDTKNQNNVFQISAGYTF